MFIRLMKHSMKERDIWQKRRLRAGAKSGKKNFELFVENMRESMAGGRGVKRGKSKATVRKTRHCLRLILG